MQLAKRVIYMREAAEYCGLDYTLLEEIVDFGLLNPDTEKEDEFFDENDLDTLRRIRRLYHTLGVNLAGIEVIMQMREKIISLQQQLMQQRYDAFPYGDQDEHSFKES